MSTVLESCHFCGQREADFVSHFGKTAVECGWCEARGPRQSDSHRKSARENALDAWNGISLRRDR